MIIFKKKSIFKTTNFSSLVTFALLAIVFATLFTYRVVSDWTPFSIMGGVCLIFTLLGVVGVIVLSHHMNYVVIDGDGIIFANAINPYRREKYEISKMSRVVFDSQVTDVTARYGGRQRIGMRYISFYIADRKIRYTLFMINESDYPLIIEELKSRGVEVECSAQFYCTK